MAGRKQGSTVSQKSGARSIGFSNPERSHRTVAGQGRAAEARGGRPRSAQFPFVWCRLLRHAPHGARPGAPCDAVTDFHLLRGSVIYCNQQAHGARRARDTDTRGRARCARDTNTPATDTRSKGGLAVRQ
jgi:hypothetical protein